MTKTRQSNMPQIPQQPETGRILPTDPSPLNHSDRPASDGWLIALTILSYVLTLPMFEPVSFWPAGYIAFAPWIAGLCLARSNRSACLVSFAYGFVFWMTHSRWMLPLSAVPYAVVCLVHGSHFVLAAWAIRHLTRQRHLPLTLVFPVVWTAQELALHHSILRTPWCLLAHSQIRLSSMIQIADLVGVLGVTFVVAMVNGCVADLLLKRLRPFAFVEQTGRSTWTVMLPTLLIVAATAVYGWIRMKPPADTAGPRVAVLQGDFPLWAGIDKNLRVLDDPPPASDEIDYLIRARKEAFNADKRLFYLRLFRQASQEQPDLYVLPETPWHMVLNREYRNSPMTLELDDMRLQHKEFVRLSNQYKGTIVVGAEATVSRPPGCYPTEDVYNSAFVYRPGHEEPDRYDKVNLVLFGEYLPFRYSSCLFGIYRFLSRGPFNPWGRDGQEYVNTPGTEYTVFETSAPSLANQRIRFGVVICYEDVLGYAYRHYVTDPNGQKRVDCMLTISNVGWFGHSVQQAQHLAGCAFRAIENRVWIARAVNTGISGFIRSDGTWFNLVGNSDTNLEPGGS